MCRQIALAACAVVGAFIVLLGFVSAHGWFDNVEDREIFLIPAGYVGRIVVVYGQPSGTAREFEDDARVYRIPRNGVLVTRFEREWMPQRHGTSYFYIGRAGVRIAIPESASDVSPDSLQITVLRIVMDSSADSEWLVLARGAAQRDSLIRACGNFDVTKLYKPSKL